MLREELLAPILAKIEPRDGAHDFGHSRRVWNMAERLASIHYPSADRLALFVAAYVHDIVPAQGADNIASVVDCALMQELLRLTDSPGSIHLAASIIEEHSYSRGRLPTTSESKCFQDADRLDALGAIGIARAFYVAGVRRSTLFSPDDPFCKQRAPDDKRYAVDHFYQKLLTLPGKMHTPSAREIAKQRADLMISFLDQLEREPAN
jgi:uncharacterized protein